jgi:hypothetical protein
VGTPRIVHPSVEEVILRPPIFKDVDTLARPLVEDTKAGKWGLLNAGMRRYGMSKTTDRDIYVRAIRPKEPVAACLITGGTNSNAAPPLTPLFRTSNSCVYDPGDMDTSLTRDAPSPSKYL